SVNSKSLAAVTDLYPVEWHEEAEAKPIIVVEGSNVLSYNEIINMAN
ncbi:6317_t:CDS:2, partial [Entrophospora sp. SA101]